MTLAVANDLTHEQHEANQEDVDQYLTFLMDGEEYGVDILLVQEIRGWEDATTIPNSPEYVKGAINLRGTIVPLIDLRLRFGIAPIDYGPVTVVIVVKVAIGSNEKVMGLVVDAVSDVYTVNHDMVNQAPTMGEQANQAFTAGLVQVNDTMISLLDLKKVLEISHL